MADAFGANCPRCGVSGVQRDESADARVNRPSGRRPRRELTQASVASAIGAILSAVVWFGSGCQQQQPAGAVDYYHRGDALYQEGKHEQAIASFREAIRIQPDFAVAYYVLGDALLEQGKLEEGIAALRDAIRQQPDNALALNRLGIGLSKQGKLEEAIAAYREAIRIQPNDADAHNNLGTALRDQGKLDEAIAEFREAIGIEPEDASAHNNLAWALVLSPKRPRRDYDEALIHARRAVERAPEDGDCFTTLALTEYRFGHAAESLAAAKQALELTDGGSAGGWFVLALACWQNGDEGQARTRFNQAVASTKQNAPPSTTLRQLWTEAAERLGQPGPDSAGAGSPAAAAQEKPR